MIETVRSELDRAHRAAVAMDAGEIRRSLTLAIPALTEAASTPAGEASGLDDAALTQHAQTLSQALADLDSGSLAAMESMIEAVRKAIAA